MKKCKQILSCLMGKKMVKEYKRKGEMRKKEGNKELGTQ